MSSSDKPNQPTCASLPATKLQRLVFALFLIGCAETGLLTCFPAGRPEDGLWLEGGFVVLAASTTLLSLARWLPAQNVMTVAVIIMPLSCAVEWLGAVSEIPFGEHTFTDHLGARIFGVLPWPIPLAWLVVTLTSRGVARLILRPCRRGTHYGFWVIGLAGGLTVLLDLGIEPYASGVKHYWLWTPTGNAPNWQGAPWVNFLGAFVTTVFILVVCTPWLINKRPGPQPPDYHPLALWALLNALLITGNAAHHLWLAAGISLTAAAVTTVFALRGARSACD